MVDFGERVKYLRTSKKLTQEQLAKQVGLTKSVISAYETGIRMPSYDVLIQFSRIFHVTTDYLLGNETTECFGYQSLSEKQKQAISSLIEAFLNTDE